MIYSANGLAGADAPKALKKVGLASIPMPTGLPGTNALGGQFPGEPLTGSSTPAIRGSNLAGSRSEGWDPAGMLTGGPNIQSAGASPAPSPVAGAPTDGPMFGTRSNPDSAGAWAKAQQQYGATGGPNMQSAGVPGVTSFNPSSNLIGSQINPVDSQRTTQAGQYTQNAAAAYAGRQAMPFQTVGGANTSGSQGIYDKLLGMATNGFGGGGGTPYDALTAQLNGKVSGALDKVLDGPDRGKLAGDAYDQLVARSQPGYEHGLRDLGKRAAALGRVGAGMTTNELTDYGLTRERDLDMSRRELATQSAQQSIADRLAQLDATQRVSQGVGGLASAYGSSRAAANEAGFDKLLTLGRDTYGRERDTYGDSVSERDKSLGYDADAFGRDRTRFQDFTGYESGERAQDRANRNELRGERDYQYGLDRDAIGDRERQTLIEDQLYGRDFDRARDRYTLGTAGNPSGAYDAAANGYGQQAAGSMDSLGNLVSTYAYNRARRGQPASTPVAAASGQTPQDYIPFNYGGG